MCYCTTSISAPWCNQCGPINNFSAHPVVSIPKYDWCYPNKYIQTEVSTKMVEAGLAVFHKTYLDRDTQLIAVYRAMHEARATTA